MQKTVSKKEKKAKITSTIKPHINKVAKSGGFPVVAIGSSSGGLEAALELFKHISPDTGMAFIYVQHISRSHKSLLTPILSKTTSMHVQEIENMEEMEPENVYVIPNNKNIVVTDGHIKLIPRNQGGVAISIDVLFSSLAETHHENVIGIVLSGNAHDGTIGLETIKKAGGVTFAQDDSAQAKSMPKSAIASGAVDYILSPKKIALELNRMGKEGINSAKVHSKSSETSMQESMMADTDPDLRTILETLHKMIHVDFSIYKMATVKRRIQHRMTQCGIKTVTLYAKYLRKKNNEVNLLYRDLLINITNFFRDEDAFLYLKTTILPNVLKSKTKNDTLRIWIPACSSGEEAYTIAMLLTELQGHKTKQIPIQIFATDLSEQAILDARTGEYPANDLKSVSPQRIKRFFTKKGTHYQIVKELRDMCVFAPHNILNDPPFSRIDFISCRNLLIYFDTLAQKTVLTTMSFALNDGGILLLGKSETVGISSKLFTQISGKYKIYSRKPNVSPRNVQDMIARPGKLPVEKNTKPFSQKKSTITSIELDLAIDSTLFSLYMPACVIINKSLEIIKFRGMTSLYLSHPPGNASLNILKMTRPEFAFELRNTIQEVIKSNQVVTKSGIPMNGHISDDFIQIVSLEARPLLIEWDEPLYLIVFAMHKTDKHAHMMDTKSHSKRKDLQIKKQIEELHKASAEMTLVIESQDRAYEELQAANEEIISASEEFQTLNEELETSKEEIEATNEELLTTNQELQIRNEQLAESYNFSEAVAETMHEPMIILDKLLRIKSANKAFCKKFHVLQAEAEGTPLYELENHLLDIPSLRQLLDNIIQKNTHVYEHEIIYTFPETGKKTMLLNARRIIQKTHNEQLILLTFTETTEIIIKSKSSNKRLEDIITERTKALEQSYITVKEKNTILEKTNKELETFTFISSHDLQEPLRKIKMFTSLLEDENKNLSVSGKSLLKKVNTTVIKMQTLIDDLLIYAGIKEGTHHFEKTELKTLTKEIIGEFKSTIDEKKAIVTVEGKCETKIIKFQYIQLIQNLISNALKFSHPKRFPRITIKMEITPGIVLPYSELHPEINYCHIAVIDNGIGFDPQYQDRIFEVFQRLNSQQLFSGTGIGLAICKRIVDNHKGKIIATGKINKGSQFDIYIPA